MDWAAILVMVGDSEDAVGGGVRWARMKMPWVASLACWRKTVDCWEDLMLSVMGSRIALAGCGCFCSVPFDSRGSWRTSIGMLSLWQAKMEFIIGMYWCARSVEGESVTIKIRDWRAFVELLFGSVAVAADWSARLDDMPVRDSWYS